MTREELIEEAATAMSRGYVQDGRISSFFALAEVAFAVFEKAQAPTGDEREALIARAEKNAAGLLGAPDADYEGETEVGKILLGMADALRRPAQTEPTDDRGEAEAMYPLDGGDPSIIIALRSAYRAGVAREGRAALKAARVAGGSDV